MNEIKMTVKEAIEQLNDLKRDREGFAKMMSLILCLLMILKRLTWL